MARQINITSTFHACNLNELHETDKNLLESARTAMKKAYAPYSGFHVGAAVMLEDNTVVTGNNQENAAYPSGLCAERVAVFSASSQFPDKKIKTIAIVAGSEKKNVDFPVSPCGACRQVISEYELKFKSPVKIIMSGDSGEIFISESVANLLPLSFNSDALK